ncbi:MAG: hypothetical protein WA510_24285 [Acidobacteriaceae bacterium]
MIPALREAFNRRFTPEAYQQFLRDLQGKAGTPIAFRVSETPCFFPRAILDQMAEYGRDLVLQLVNNAEYLRASEATVPSRYNVAGESARPMFLQVDFGLVRNGQGELEPKLVELQAFPSLYEYQPVLAHQYIESYGLAADLAIDLGIYLGGHDAHTYQQLLRDVIVGGHDPENVILLEIQPETQKTFCDFLITQRELDIAIVDILQLKKHGQRLFYERDGRQIPVKRIYNRCIADELERRGIELPFDMTQPLDVEWAGHPNWYYRISKFSIPWLKHRCVPETWLLDEHSKVPQDNDNYVLKPLYSFAGLGIRFAPTQADVDAIPFEQRHHYMLQERLHFAPVIETPHGMTQAEIRIMYVWPEGGEMTAVLPLLRMGRGMMMGVDHNRGLEWVGGSAALWV